MTQRELFLDIMNYRPFSTVPVVHWHGWDETIERWHHEGLPADVGVRDFLNVPAHWTAIGVNVGLFPFFEEQTLEETSDKRTYRDREGVICQAFKGQSNIPHYIDFTLKTPADWEQHYRPRLQPDAARCPANLSKRIESCLASELPVAVDTGSMMGWIRNWMGVENLAYFMYDHRDVFSEMVMTLADLVCWGLDQTLPHIKVDFGFGWEDICGRSGPFVSPDIFRECVAPGYRKIREKLEQYGVSLYGIDSDGDIEALAGPWLDAGVNILFPVEVGVWHADGMALRRKYGRDLRIIGHFDKMTLERDRAAVNAEFERIMPLIRDGGYMPMPDHLITPGVSLDMYRWFLERWRQIRI